jgi:hypothetical protein
MVYMDAGSPGTFVDLATGKSYLANYWNRRRKLAATSYTANRTTTSTTWVEIDTEIRITFVTWADEAVDVQAMGVGSANNTNRTCNTAVAFDSTTTPSSGTYQMGQPTTSGASSVAAAWSALLTEGQHYATLLHAVGGGAGTLTIYGGAISGSTVVNRGGMTITLRA